jgi:hypothetical protein
MESVKQIFTETPLLSVQYHHRKPCRILGIIREEIRLLVEVDDLANAADLLSELMALYTGQRSNEASLLKRRICALEKDIRAGVLGYDDANREKNRIGSAILESVESLD